MVILVIAALTIALSAISLVFFRIGRGFAWKKRVGASLHGVALALAILYGLAIELAGLTGSSALLQLPPLPVFLACVCSIAYSSWLYRRRWPYLLLHLFTMALLLPALYWVGIAVVGWT